MARYRDVITNTDREWSAIIYSFTSDGTEYYGYSDPVSFNYNDPEGRDPKSSSPGYKDPLHNTPTYFAYKLIAYIHSHLPTPDAIGGQNEKFSGDDNRNNSKSKNMNMYLANFQGDLIVYRGMDSKTKWGTFEGSNITVTIGTMTGRKFTPNKYFEGTLAPIKTGWRDIRYGNSIKKKN